MIRVLIAEPHQFTWNCLRILLEREPDIQVLGETDSFDRAVPLVRQLNPDVVLIDVDPGHSKGLEILHQIMFQPSKPAVVVLVTVTDLATRADFVKACVTGYYCWRDPLSELLAAIRAVHAGHTYVSERAAKTILHRIPLKATP